MVIWMEWQIRMGAKKWYVVGGWAGDIPSILKWGDKRKLLGVNLEMGSTIPFIDYVCGTLE